MTDAQKNALLTVLHDLRMAVDCAEARLFGGRDLRDHELRQQFTTIRRLAARMPQRRQVRREAS